MTSNLENDIDASLAHEERAVRALEDIAEALQVWCKLQQAIFDRTYPEKREPRDAVVTRIPTAEDKLRAMLGGKEKSLEEWLSPGTFESRFDRSQQDSKRANKAAKAGSAAPAKSEPESA